MARAIWTGALTFGLVNVPVALVTASHDRSIRFHQFQAGTSDRIRLKRVNERTGDEVPYEEIVKGYDLGGGEYVIVTPEELEAVAAQKSRSITVAGFVDLADIDPIYFERAYFLTPSGEVANRAYALLLEAMTRKQKVAIATFVMRDREHLAAVRPHDGVLVLETLLHADEVRAPEVHVATDTLEDRELEMASMLIDSMASAFDPAAYPDTYRERVAALIEQRRDGRSIVLSAPAERVAPVVDLLAALEQSVSAVRGGDQREAAVAATPGPQRRAARPTASRTARLDVPLEQKTKAELQRRAADLGISGRSRMSRDELLDALRSAAAARRAS